MRRARHLTLALLGVAFAVLFAMSFFVNHSYVDTPSMWPNIPPGSEVIVSAKPTYNVGDVIEFHANGLTWVHRLVKVNADGTYVTKGDNPQNAPDVFVPAITRTDVVGSVDYAPRWLGFPELFVHRPGYALAWLRTELGLAGRIMFVLAVTVLGFGLALNPKPKKKPEVALAA